MYCTATSLGRCVENRTWRGAVSFSGHSTSGTACRDQYSQTVIQLIVTPGAGRGIGALTRHVLDELQSRLRTQCMDIFRGGATDDFDGQFGVRTFPLEPPSAGVLAIALTATNHHTRAVVFTLTGLAAVTFAGPLRALAGELRRRDPTLTIAVNTALSRNLLARPGEALATPRREPGRRSAPSPREPLTPRSLRHHPHR